MAQIISFGGYTPQIDPTAYIAESAVIIGHVIIKEGAGIWPNTVIRGDENSIIIGRYVDIQDNSTVHVQPDQSLEIGDYTMIGHNALVHGAFVGTGCLIGMGAVLMPYSEVGSESIIGAGTMVTQRKRIPPRSLAYGMPFRVIRSVTDEEIAGVRTDVMEYYELAQKYKKNRRHE
ncbi:gamma carbonic anhydrase family protein [Megasphaera cerevisiae]|uniref:gamma carbonic anhydrase family protein n=1 Tax=Megasphaera cerevisiae TaxID=39029 RepID=UPI000944ED3A|nr:gamma carbonic anhydrase family protein [Megasphaera cerevisiae]OKY54200.1 gamma carbonic anhydrase family protein [Megasphaera cerevisiae]